jgi:hypothetical protein
MKRELYIHNEKDFWYEVKRIEKEENRLRYYAGDYDQSPIVEQYISLEDIEHINQMKNKIVIPNFIIELFHAITTSLITQKQDSILFS